MTERDAHIFSCLQRNLQRAQTQIAEALEACGRGSQPVRLVAVSKYANVDLTRQLVRAGCRALGESRPQSLWEKHAALVGINSATSVGRQAVNDEGGSTSDEIEWHMIGHLQRNKAARTVALIDWLHSLDSLRLAETLNIEAAKRAQPLKVLVEVNASQDANKTGLPRAEVPALIERLLAMPALQVRGLMAMSTEPAPTDQALREFNAVRELRDSLSQQFAPELDLRELSMGMSNDFAAGIAAGATMVRLGSLLWEGVL